MDLLISHIVSPELLASLLEVFFSFSVMIGVFESSLC